MTAKEAYTNALWNNLPNAVKNFIINAARNGKFKVDIEWGLYAIVNREANIRTIESLRELGYTVNCTEDKTLQISWDYIDD